MRTGTYLTLGAALASSAVAFPGGGWFKPKVNPDDLMAKIKLADLVAGAQQLEDFAYKYPARNRVFGEQAHKDTVDWLYNELKATRYYDVEKQEQKQLWSRSDQSFKVNDKEIQAFAMTYAPSGNVTAEFFHIENGGCADEDFDPDVKGKIALIQRGTCDFGAKVARAGAAEAVGAVVYNNGPGELRGTLGAPESEIGPYVPVVGISQEDGENIVSQLGSGAVIGDLWVDTQMENRTTWNVIATSKQGNKNNIIALGAHTDSVDAGPGINDDGSGTVGILTVAKALTHFRLNNAVRFGFWTAEEFGLLGSAYYVDSLSEKERKKIRLYLNFDMIASPNYAYLIYDGDGSAFNNTGPAGSAEIEALFEKYFDDQGIAHFPTAFDGRSDYEAFILNGIPAGGIFTGAEEVKTEEQAKLFGGTAGESYDPNYHAVGDNMTNLALDAFYLNTRGVAYALATYADSVKSLPPKEKPETVQKRALRHRDDHAKCTGCGRCSI
ncbi:hypothetical protein VTO42DRAFT_3450 [Malbranchea cinnamomea]